MNAKKLIESVYNSFHMNFIYEMYSKKGRPADPLTTSEIFSMEVIVALGRPTVNQFASYLHLTSPNAAYKVNHLVSKGYLNKIQSETDKRVFYLEATQKYLDHYAINRSYTERVFARTRKRLTKEEWATFKKVMTVIHEEQEAESKLFGGK